MKPICSSFVMFLLLSLVGVAGCRRAGESGLEQALEMTLYNNLSLGNPMEYVANFRQIHYLCEK